MKFLNLKKRTNQCEVSVKEFVACPMRIVWVLTARQYGEVVLPDDSTGQRPCTLATKLSRCKEGMARVFAVRVQI